MQSFQFYITIFKTSLWKKIKNAPQVHQSPHLVQQGYYTTQPTLTHAVTQTSLAAASPLRRPRSDVTVPVWGRRPTSHQCSPWLAHRQNFPPTPRPMTSSWPVASGAAAIVVFIYFTREIYRCPNVSAAPLRQALCSSTAARSLQLRCAKVSAALLRQGFCSSAAPRSLQLRCAKVSAAPLRQGLCTSAAPRSLLTLT